MQQRRRVQQIQHYLLLSGGQRAGGPRPRTGQRQRYALRKQTPEPLFGIIKPVLGFRQFLLRGLDRVRGEWKLVTMAWNMKRMFVLENTI
jgi:hypothetical protein